jgi:polyhydroxybutyrate depolymerase
MKKLILILSILISSSVFSKTVKLKSKFIDRSDLKVNLPKSFKKKDKWPLIISMHGYGGSSQIQNYYVRLKSFQNEYGFVFASPNGLKNSEGKTYWNASNFCCDFEEKNIDDVAYIKSIIEEISNSSAIGRIDTSRIYLIGYSNGAFLASKIACSSEVKVAGVVSISGTSDLRDENGELIAASEFNCGHNRPIPTLHIHGTLDKTISYDGKDNGNTGHVGALDHIKRWSIQNGCTGKLTKSSTPLNASNFLKGKETDHFKMTKCEAPVEHFRINEGPHFGIFKKSFTKKILNFLFR